MNADEATADSTDDTEGHAMRGRGLEGADEGDLVGDADTEGHGFRGKP